MFLLPEDTWEIKKTENKGRGVYAKKEIGPGVIIGDYLGRVVKTAEEDIDEKDNFYLMYYHDYATIFPDLSKPGIHLLNHSCTPNSWMYTHKGHTLFFTLRKIFPGEELTVHYLLSPQDEDCKPCTHLCLENGPFCTGSMHLTQEQYDAWEVVHDKQASQTKRQAIRYGKDLPPLSEYPETIADHPVYPIFGNPSEPEVVLSYTSLPATKDLRSHLRHTGKMLKFPKLKQKVLGVKADIVYSTAL